MPAAAGRAPLPAGAVIALVVGVALAASVVGYASTLRGYFQGDDFGFVGHYFDFPLSEWPRLFFRGWADGLWSSSYRELRPLNALAFIVDARLWGVEPMGYRLTNLAVHAMSAALVGLIAWRVSRREAMVAAIAAGFFALHPVNAHAVAWITGRVDLLSTAFLLAGFLGFLGYRDTARDVWLVLLAGGQAGAVFTKESGVTLVGFLVLADLLWLRPRVRGGGTWWPYAVCGTLLVAYFSCRWIAFGDGHPGGIGRGLPDLAATHTYLEFLRREVAYLAHLLPPLQPWLVAWRDDGFALGLGRIAQVMLTALAVVLAGWMIRRWLVRTTLPADRAAVVFFAGAWFAVGTAPLMATYFSARHLYLAAPGLCVAGALGLRAVFPRLSASVGIATLLGGFLLTQAWQTLAPWRRGAELSLAIAHEVHAAAARVPAGGALLVDAPALVEGAFCWSWALPYALQPPFAAARSGREPTLLQAPDTYAFSAAWRRPELFARLGEIEGDCLLVERTPRGELRTVTIPAARVRAAARHLRGESREEDAEMWQRFLTALREW